MDRLLRDAKIWKARNDYGKHCEFEAFKPERSPKNGKRGGIKSGESRRRRKALREELRMLLEDGDMQERLCLALINEALNGNLKAFDTILRVLGEPVGRDEVSLADDPFALDNMFQ